MAGFMDLFKSAPSEAAPAAKPVETNNAGTQSPATPDGKMPGSDQTPANPLDAYSKMFETAGNEETPPAFNLDPTVIDTVASGLDFTKAIPQDLMQKVMAGDGQAMLQAMNIISQQAYKTGLQHTSTLTDKFVSARASHESKGLGSAVRKELTTNALSNTPNYNHPAVKNQLNMIATSLSKQHPDAPPAEVAKMAQDYLFEVVKAITPASSTDEQGTNAAPGEVDWSKYLQQ